MEIFKTKKQGNVSLNQLISEKIALCTSERRHNTALKYGALLRKVETNFGIVRASDMTPQFAIDFKSKLEMSGCNNTTQASFLSCLRAIWNYAAYKGYVDSNEYMFRQKSYQLDRCPIPKCNKRVDSFLTKAEMTKLYNHIVGWKPKGKAEITARRMSALFMFSYLCNGCNLADALRMTYNQDYFRSGGKLLTFIRHKTASKTGVKVRVPVTEKLQKILDIIADKPSADRPVLGSFLGKVRLTDERAMTDRILYMNCYGSKRTREVCQSIGINVNVSMTFARHTYSTVLHHSGCPFYIVEKNMGHVCNDVAFNYIGDAPVEELFRWNELLLD